MTLPSRMAAERLRPRVAMTISIRTVLLGHAADDVGHLDPFSNSGRHSDSAAVDRSDELLVGCLFLAA